MSTSHEIPATPGRLTRSSPLSFRAKLRLWLMLIVFTATAISLYVAQRVAQVSDEANLRNKFQTRLGYLNGAREARETEVSEQCRRLAQSVRIQAALEEQDVEDLYANARIELRDVLDNGQPPAQDAPVKPPRATFFRFLTIDGKLLEPTSSSTPPEPWENQITAAGAGATTQQIGYVTVTDTAGNISFHEIVITPILGPEGEKIAQLVLGFPPVDPVGNPDPELKTGLCVNGQLDMPGLPAAERAPLAESIARIIHSPGNDANFVVKIGNEPYLLSYKILNPGSHFIPAYEVCLYSLSASMAQQQRWRWRIVGTAVLVLLFGLGVSHLLSSRLSRPVEQMAEVSAQNVARREEAEAERDMTEQKYQSIFENAAEGIFLLTPEGNFTSANPAMARIFGYASSAQLRAEPEGRAKNLYAQPDTWEEFLSRIQSENRVSNFECEAKTRDGKVIWISQNARAVRDAAGKLLYLEGTVEDITDRRHAADALRKLNIELEKALADLRTTQNQVIQQERLRALGQMASGIAHDFNNSLMPIMGFSELLLAHPAILDDKEKTSGYLETIRTAAKDAASIVSRLREFYRSNENSDVFAPVNLAQLLRQSISLTQPKWKGQAQASGAETRIVEELETVPPVSGDESALREVFANLIFNAVDAMPRGGSITLRTRGEESGVTVEIADTGGGMSEEVRQRCLEPFFTTKGNRGTGLGLAMVFGIVQRHGGTLDLRTEQGKGTTFILHFPLQVSIPAAIVESQSLPNPDRLHVLLVEDEPQVRDVLTAFLETDGHSVGNAEDGAEGLRRFLAEKFDLVITDKAMPGMSGNQLALEIKRFSPHMPVVLLSGFNTGDNDKGPGIDVIVSKPITIPALRKAIRRARETA